MSESQISTPSEKENPPRLRLLRPRRAAWRQSLVEAERGFARGFRSDSSLYSHFFGICMILTTAFVLGLTVTQWAMVVLAMTIALAAELFYLMIKTFAQSQGDAAENESAKTLMQIGTAAVLVCLLGTLIVVLLIFGQALSKAIGG